jgi:hypothetical protein
VSIDDIVLVVVCLDALRGTTPARPSASSPCGVGSKLRAA